jgi:hypothetical protein
MDALPSEARTSDTASERLSRWRRLALLVAAPLLLIGPSLLPGKRFLPQLPVQTAPLAAEHPAAAAAASDGANLLASDRVLPFLTDQLAIREQAKRGVLPTWEPLLGMGVPLFAGSIVSPAYPPNWLAIALPPDLAAGWLAVLCLCLGGAGTWCFLARLGLSEGACVIGALAFQTAGWAAVNLHYPMKVDAAVWLPWSLWAVEGLARGRRGAGFLLALFTALSFLAGFVPIAVFSSTVVLLYAIRLLWPRARVLVFTGVFVALGVAGAAIQLVPTAEASGLSVRQDQSAERLAAQALPLGVAASLVAPDLFGGAQEVAPGPHPVAAWVSRPSEQSALEIFNALEWNAFAGAAAVLLALTALIATPRRALVPFALLALAWGFAQGWPVLRFVLALPGFDLGAPGRALAVQWLLWPWLAALGAQAVIERRPRAISALLMLAFALCVLAFFFWTSFDPSRWAKELRPLLAARFERTEGEVEAILGAELRLRAARDLHACSARVLATGGALVAAALCGLLLGRSQATFGRTRAPWNLGKLVLAVAAVLALFAVPSAAASTALVAIPLLLGLVLAATLLRGRDCAGLAAWLPLALVVAIEGAAHAVPHLAPRTLDGALFPESASLRAVADAAGDGRVLRLDESETLDDVLALARPNLLQPYGVRDLTPYMVFTPRTLIELFGAMDERTRHLSGIARLPSATLLDHPILDVARVTAILARRPVAHPRLELVHEAPSFVVYRRTGVPPIAHVVADAITAATDEAALGLLASGAVDPARQVVLSPGVAPGVPPGDGTATDPFVPGRVALSERPSPSRLDVKVDGTSGGWLVFHEQYYPGWKAVVDGRDAEIVRVNHAQRAVRIPAGSVGVRTKYEPWSLRIGAIASVLSLTLAAWLSRRRFVTRVP